jgi:hypothetical protein
MRSIRIVAALGIAACTTAFLPAQMAICGGVNHVVEDPHEDFVLPGAMQLAAQLTLESSATVQRVEWLFSGITGGETVFPNSTNHGAGAGIVEIRTTDPATGLPSAVVLGTGNYVDANIGGGVMIFPVGGWHGVTFPAPVILSDAVPYWITFRVGPPVDTLISNPESFLAVDIIPSQPTPYTTRTNGSQTWQPVLADKFFKIRVMSTDCTVTGPVASATPFGFGCGGASLTTFGTSALGSPSFGIRVQSAPGVPAAVFLGMPAPRGGIQLTTSCHLYLEPLTLAPAPILSGMTNTAGVLQLTASIPLDPGLLGAQLTIQAAAFVPNGPVGIGQTGYGLALSEGMQITVGY